MENMNDSRLITITVGPTDVEFPVEWTPVPTEHPGFTVATMPVDDELRERMAHTAEMLPNVVVRFFPSETQQGGVAWSTADCLRGLLHEFTGSTLLSWDYFYTGAGLPGREIAINGMQAGIPFTQWHWFIGAAESVVEITLTLPVGLSGIFLELGRTMAYSVRPKKPTAPSAEPVIPQEAIDTTATTVLSQPGDGTPSLPLEKAPSITEKGLQLPNLPGLPHHIPQQALETLSFIQANGDLVGFSAKIRSRALSALEKIRWVQDGALTQQGQKVATCLQREPDITGNGQLGAHNTDVKIYLHGDSALTLLGPTAQDILAGKTDTQYVLWEHYRTIPVILAAWSGMRASWPIDISARVDLKELENFIYGHTLFGQPKLSLTSPNLPPEIHKDINRQPCSFWAIDIPALESFTRWVQTNQRGPLELTAQAKNTGTLKSFIPIDWHDALTRTIDQLQEKVLKPEQGS